MDRFRCARFVSGSKVREFMVSIGSYSEAEINGYVSHPALNQCRRFESLQELIHLISARLDELGIAQPATALRSFCEPNILEGREGMITILKDQKVKNIPPKLPCKPEFLIRLNMRQNATWQGELCWVNDGRKIHFRSLLEMVNLMQEAIDISGLPQAESAFRSWYDESTSESTG